MKKYGLYAFHLLLLLLVVQVVWVLIWNYFFFLFSMVALLIPWLLYPEYFERRNYQYNSYILFAAYLYPLNRFLTFFHLISTLHSKARNKQNYNSCCLTLLRSA